MSRRDQQKRIDEKGRDLSDFYQQDKVKEYFLFVVNETKSLSRYLNEILTFALAEKMSSRLYYEIFDLETRGDRFRIEVSAGSYSIKMSIFVDGNLVIEDTAIYDIPKRAFTTPSISDIANVLPSEYLSVSQRRRNPSSVQETQLKSIIKSFLRLSEWCDELLCSYKGQRDALEEAITIGSDLYHEDISPKASKKLRIIEAWLPDLEDLCKNLQRWDKALQVVENQFDKTDMGYLIFVEKLAQITLSGWQSYNVIAGEKMGTSEKRWKLREAQYQIGSLNSALSELDKTLTLMRESEVFFRIQSDILKIIAKSGAKEMIDESRAERLDLDLWGRRRNPVSSLGAIALAGIAGFVIGKSK